MAGTARGGHRLTQLLSNVVDEANDVVGGARPRISLLRRRQRRVRAAKRDSGATRQQQPYLQGVKLNRCQRKRCPAGMSCRERFATTRQGTIMALVIRKTAVHTSTPMRKGHYDY
jgi:hypothetical protein